MTTASPLWAPTPGPTHAPAQGLRVAYIQDNGIDESLALTEVAGGLAAMGATNRLFLTDEEPDLDAALRAFDPALVLLPNAVGGRSAAAARAARARRALPRATLLYLGTEATFDPTVAEDPHVDGAVVGEAEGPTAAVAEALAAGRDWRGAPGLVSRDPHGGLRRNPLPPVLTDLDALPWPARDLYYRYPFIARFPTKKFNTSRGCVHDCSFCWNPKLRGMVSNPEAFTRRKSVDRAISEVEAVRAATPLKHVHFADDLFTVQPAWLERFAEAYPGRVGLPFTCSSSVELVSRRSMAALAKAGCKGVAIGVETANEQVRERILRKTVSNAEVVEAARRVKDAGLELTVYAMIGIPGETIEDAWNTLRFLRQLGADHARVMVALPVPHTDFAEAAAAQGALPAGARVDDLSDPVEAFAIADARAQRNLYYFFRPLLRRPGLDPVVRPLLDLPWGRSLAPLKAFVALEERRIAGIGWVDGLRYWRHTGDPRKRTTNYVTLP